MRTLHMLSGMVILALICVEAVPAAAPSLVGYQGRLTDNAGAAVADGNYSMVFRIFDAPALGNLVWSETQSSVAVASGNFHTLLGSVVPLEDSVFASATRYLEVEVNGEALSPRTRMVSSGYAHRIAAVDGAKGGLVSGALEVRTDANPATALTISEAGGASAFEVAVDATGAAAADLSGSMTIQAAGNPGTALRVAEAGGKTTFEVTIDATGNASASILNPVDTRGGGGAVQSKLIEIGKAGLTIFGATEADTNLCLFPNGSISGKGAINMGDSTKADTTFTIRSGGPTAAIITTSNVAGYAQALYAAISGVGGSDSPAAIQARSEPTDSTGAAIWCIGNRLGISAVAGGSIGEVKTGVNGLALGGSNSYSTGTNGFARGPNINYGARGIARDGAVNYGVYGTAGGSGTLWAGYFEGNTHVTGTLSKGAGAFRIDHPLDPANKYLQHSFVESPDMMNVYNGNVMLDGSGQAEVQLPTYFDALNRDFRYQLTAVGAPGPNLHVAEEIAGNRFRIAGGQPGMKVSWQVTGVRKDAYAEANRIQVEVTKNLRERGKYAHPEALGKSEELGLDYEAHEALRLHQDDALTGRLLRP